MIFAVHIADGVLAPAWLAGGLAVTIALVALGAWRIRDEDIPRVALLTAAFFVASLIHVRVGPTSVHLLLNGLVGVVLGRRAALAIPVGVFLQAVLFQHGGFTVIGVNSAVMTLPALAAGQVFAGLQRVPWARRPWFRAALVAVSAFAWALSLVYSVALLAGNGLGHLSDLDLGPANRAAAHPLALAGAADFAAAAAWAERRLENAPEFALGLLVGELAVLLTTFLAALVLVWGGADDWPALVLLVLVPHVVIAVVEGIVLGFTVGFLARVKPELLGAGRVEEAACLADPVA